MKRCRECGETMVVSRENYRYEASGLPNVILRNVEVRRCKACGAFDVAIPRLSELHRSIAAAVIAKTSPLVPAEIKFLRKHLGWSGADFAAHMGTTPETVSRWENGRLAMSATADRLLRTLVAVKEPTGSYSIDVLRSIQPTRTAKPLKVGLRLEKNGWTADAA